MNVLIVLYNTSHHGIFCWNIQDLGHHETSLRKMKNFGIKKPPIAGGKLFL